MSHNQPSRTNAILGYPEDARLLIINADDFGMYHAVNAGIFQSLTQGIVSSTTVMIPCPWAWHAIEWLKEHPSIPFGVHLTLICDFAHNQWGPLSPKERVPSLVDATGYFFNYEHIPDLLNQAKLDEVEIEFRAQIESVLADGLHPTHLDWHCLGDGGRPDIFNMSVRLAHDYGLGLRVSQPSHIEALQQRGLPTNEHGFVDSFRLDIARKSAIYADLLRDLPAGLTEWAVHPALGSGEAQAIDPGGWQVRHSDFEFVVSAEARAIIQSEGIIILDYRVIQAAWQRTNGSRD